MHADYRKQIDFIVKAQNSPSQFSPEHSKTYIPHDFIKNPRFKRAVIEEVEKQNMSPFRQIKESSTQTATSNEKESSFPLQRCQSYVPGLKRTQPHVKRQELRTAETAPLPQLSKFANELNNNVQLELLQSRNPHDSKTLGMIKNQQFSPPKQRVPNKELVPEIQEEGLLFEICNEANQNNLKTVTDWERLNGKKLNQIISDEY
ncbi:Hypothetical_protein [Hexamita inflata]|uniref:Hypothetical_protein n=1 Tax=Hexamita inflata TaxID=28002 RepID=A0AA86R188_9EUKA|nr:Hypothetical protein HINF_LOCUS22467 [Hexamita inflata]CAI9957656.1 Hypothetical protein HINF_LOCUS45301 [Hexamita inflata]CAI9963709.1 Hypothetical protein HINF_LOCUS51354 [Hexamita inflata]CAI9964559.1 Hypothetical protein HINF_LOCUS52204 [Hexamita inflata]